MKEKSLGYHRTQTAFDFPFFLLLLALSLIGSLMIFSASTAYAETRFGDAYYFVKRQSLWLILGILSMLAVSRIPPKCLYTYALPLFLCCLFLLALVPLIGSEASAGSHSVHSPFSRPSFPKQH